MGLFWDLVQQSQISEQKARAVSIEERRTAVESEIARTQQIVHVLLERLENHLGEDVDGDGRVADRHP